MDKLRASELRKLFLDYFAARGHRVVRSSPLIPPDDPTLLFTNAGMVQFKDIFTGSRSTEYSRATSSQKCLRVSGKHNDLEMVGRTPRHHTFFEMLGNFSFGDYFKEEAIEYAWEMLTQVFGLDPERLWVSVYKDDDEAYRLWNEKMHVPERRILRLGEKDNFWSMGDTGPCGPCSEILWDRGPEYGDDPEYRLLEIWNLVFMQYDRTADGTLNPLPRPSIDTGMGLERLAAVVQGVESNYETDLFLPLLQLVAELASKVKGADSEDDFAMRVIADHARATAFLVSDAVFPENEGRGYVLRRIMRRAIRYGQRLGMGEVFFHKVCLAVVDLMGQVFPELEQSRVSIGQIVLREEELFRRTLDRGLDLIERNEVWQEVDGQRVMPGQVAFKLYDTFGFPLDLTQVIGEEKGFRVDTEGFASLMAEQKAMGRASWKGQEGAADRAVFKEISARFGSTTFSGYEVVELQNALVHGLVKGGDEVDVVGEGDVADMIVDNTPYYAESGGQVGDTGIWRSKSGRGRVMATDKREGGLFVHRIVVEQGTVREGEGVELVVDVERRKSIQRSHSATHLLHAALRRRLGEHVKQQGSLVEPGRLRFDFSHFAPLTKEDLAAVEQDVNAHILTNEPAHVEQTSMDEAISRGALAFFGEKYGERVRLVEMGSDSKELCGGTHVARTGDIGIFVILAESGIAAGVRRIEAATGMEAVRILEEQRETLDEVARSLNVASGGAVERVGVLQARIKGLEKEVEKLKSKMAAREGVNLMDGVREVAGVRLLAARVDGMDAKALRELGDTLKDRLKSGVVVLMGASDGKVVILAMSTGDVSGRVKAGALVGELAKMVGGRGGGRPEMAQGGGDDVDGIDDALKAVPAMVEKALR